MKTRSAETLRWVERAAAKVGLREGAVRDAARDVLERLGPNGPVNAATVEEAMIKDRDTGSYLYVSNETPEKPRQGGGMTSAQLWAVKSPQAGLGLIHKHGVKK